VAKKSPLRGRRADVRYAHEPNYQTLIHVIASRHERRGDPGFLDCFAMFAMTIKSSFHKQVRKVCQWIVRLYPWQVAEKGENSVSEFSFGKCRV